MWYYMYRQTDAVQRKIIIGCISLILKYFFNEVFRVSYEKSIKLGEYIETNLSRFSRTIFKHNPIYISLFN